MHGMSSQLDCLMPTGIYSWSHACGSIMHSDANEICAPDKNTPTDWMAVLPSSLQLQTDLMRQALFKTEKTSGSGQESLTTSIEVAEGCCCLGQVRWAHLAGAGSAPGNRAAEPGRRRDARGSPAQTGVILAATVGPLLAGVALSYFLSGSSR